MIQWGFPTNCLIWTIREMEERKSNGYGGSILRICIVNLISLLGNVLSLAAVTWHCCGSGLEEQVHCGDDYIRSLAGFCS